MRRCGNVCADGERYHERGTQPGATPDHREQAERRHELAQQLPEAVADVLRERDRGFAEHDVAGHDTDDCTRDLSEDVCFRVAPWEPTLRRIGQRHGGIEMRARDRAESQDQGDERGTRRDRVREQCEPGAAARQPLTHGAGSHDRSQQ